jgi:hypothetical protein
MNRVVWIAGVLCVGIAVAGGAEPAGKALRTSISLDGVWDVAEGGMDQAPREFKRRAPVPGLADMAAPAFAAVGTPESGKHRQAFWFRRTFTLDGPVPTSARLMLHKAKYGARVLLNGKQVGEHLPSFTLGEFDVRDFLRAPGQANELLIRVGAHRDVLPKGLPDGFDFEKVRYIPGIYDSVELVLCGAPRVVNVQTAPDLKAKTVRVVAELEGDRVAAESRIRLVVREAKGGRTVGAAEAPDPGGPGRRTIDVKVPIEGCRFWSPEDPFLYDLEVSTAGDTARTRFGMRSFHFDPKTRQAMLNGKPYPMRGTNVCAYRFFEDPARGDRPWREEWVRRLHRAFKGMHWNSIRYCIGFPPEVWYRVADEEGILIQDEFPIWYGTDRWPKDLKSEELVKEYTEWMRQRWNHPCVVIWDAQNETVSPELGKAIRAVRGLDLSNRPWDNGWSPPQAPTDVYEAHPYAHGNPAFRLSTFARLSGAAGSPGSMSGNVLPNKDLNPVIINEYGWLWLNRDGTPTTLSKQAYANLLGENATSEQRRELYARLLAAKTEFWRCRRQVAGVLHFCGLGYSRPGGQTSDHFLDLETLAFEPHFFRYVGEAFHPVGLMADFWDDDPPPGQERKVPVVVINDLYDAWNGLVRLQLLRGQEKLLERSAVCRLAPLGSQTLSFDVKLPAETGRYQFVAELLPAAQDEYRPIRSLRDFAILTAAERAARDGIATGKPVTASSNLELSGATSPAAAVDGNPSTRWSSQFSDPQWIAIDLGRPEKISRVELLWEAAFGKAYSIDVSADGNAWQTVYKTETGAGGADKIRFKPVEARWVRMNGARRGTQFGYSLWEFRVFP